MERSSWPGHFRNCDILRRDWHTGPFSGTISRLISPAFLLRGDSAFTNHSMGNAIPNRGCRGALWCAVWCALFGVVLAGVAFADSSVTTASSPSAAPKPQTSTHKRKAHTTAHKTSDKSTSRKSTGQKTAASRRNKGSKNSRSSRKRGQQAIDHERARAIQEALIREHYLQGAPSGTWDATTQAAMQRYQADHGWQSKTTPDSRALIKLGLGPSNDHLLNPESAMTSAPAAGDPKATTKAEPAQTRLPQQ